MARFHEGDDVYPYFCTSCGSAVSRSEVLVVDERDVCSECPYEAGYRDELEGLLRETKASLVILAAEVMAAAFSGPVRGRLAKRMQQKAEEARRQAAREAARERRLQAVLSRLPSGAQTTVAVTRRGLAWLRSRQ